MKLCQIKDLYPKAIQYDLSDSSLNTLLLKELKGKAGIYCWYNISTDLFYIGSSDNLRRRMSSYLSLAYLTNHKGSSVIYSALLKYGFASFALLILETMESGNKIKLLELEQKALDTCKPAYNILPIAGSSLGFNHSSETKALLSNLKKGSSISEAVKAKLSELSKGSGNPFFGKRHTPESLVKMSDIKKGELNPMFGKVKSPEFLAKQSSDAKTGAKNPRYGKPASPHFAIFIQPKPVYVYDSISKELIMSIPEGIVVAKKTLNIGYDTLKRCCISDPKEVFTPRKGPLQNRKLIFSHTPLSRET